MMMMMVMICIQPVSTKFVFGCLYTSQANFHFSNTFQFMFTMCT